MTESSKALPLTGFIRLLQANGFTIGVDHHLRLQRLLNKIDKDISPGEIKTLLCPVFASSQKQQNLFMKLFDQYFKLFQTKNKIESSTSQSHQKIEQQLFKHNISWKLILGVITVLIIFCVVFYGVQEEPEVIERVTTEIETVNQTNTQHKIQKYTITINPDIAPKKLTFYEKYGLVIRWLGLILPFVFFIFGVLHRFRKRQIVLENSKGRPPPTWRKYTFQRPDVRFLKNRSFFKAALLFRKRLKSNIRQLDIDKTVETTIKEPGFPVFCYKNLTRPPEYLVLIHMPHPNDHNAALNDSLVQALKKEDIDITLYYYQHDPRLCFINKDKAYLTISDLWKKHSDCRLVIFGTGDNFINPFIGEPESWITSLKQWPKRALMTPKPAKIWGLREARLANDWLVLPSNMEGLNAVIKYFEYPSKYVISKWITESLDVIPNKDLNDPERLKQRMGPSAFRWLCACAIYPEIHYNLTLRIGQCLYPKGQLSSLDLLKMIQLPWFIKGLMPDKLRYSLIRSLGEKDTVRVREVIVDVLKENPSQEGEPGFHLHTLNLAIQKWAISPESRKLKKQWRKKLSEIPEADILQDYTLVKQIDTVKTSPLQFLLPDSFLRVFYRHHIPVFGLRTGVRFIRTLLIVAIVFFFMQTPETSVKQNVKPVVSFDFVKINAGKFMMGSPESEKGRGSDEVLHEVVLTNDYLLQTTEITQGQWQAIMGKNPSYFSNCGEDCPVENVSWNDVQEFISRLNRLDSNYHYRLPTEAEWEYAARAGSSAAFANGDIKELKCEFDPNLDKMGWYCGNSCVTYEGGYDCSGWGKGGCTKPKCGTHPVAQKQPNAWKLYDMHGNVWEWCSDWLEDYPTKSVIDPKGAESGKYRLLRGGPWDSIARHCRSGVRRGVEPAIRDGDVGARLAASFRSAPKANKE